MDQESSEQAEDGRRLFVGLGGWSGSEAEDGLLLMVWKNVSSREVTLFLACLSFRRKGIAILVEVIEEPVKPLGAHRGAQEQSRSLWLC